MVFINHVEALDGEAAIVDIEGPLDSETSPDLEDYINQLLYNNIRFILFDAKKLSYVSSEGIGATLFLQKKIAENNGFIVICNIPPEIMSLYEILGFDKIFRIAGSRIEAMQIMDRQIELRSRSVGDSGQKEPGAAVDESYTAVYEDQYDDKEEEDNSNITDYSGEFAESEESGSSIVECIHCKSLIRTTGPGDYLCPFCNKEFVLDSARTPASVQEPASITVHEEQSPAVEPFIVECIECNSLIRAGKSGKYRCPSCSRVFRVMDDLTVKF
ncbi:MAG: STAS domain-containing protein [bacterium]|nr:STAS domain-containing protein [bacterium]